MSVSTPVTVRPVSNSVPSIIAADMTVKGDLQSTGEVHVDGTVLGDVEVQVLVIAEHATVRGEIRADQVRVCGHVTGMIRARSVTLTATARMIGDVNHEVLAIEAGAYVEGQYRRITPAVEQAAPATTNPDYPAIAAQ
ncbi:MAG: polymer-forming cytoskeletal protein [Alphaproteobacteria bacterium]|nr:polymer-forming cytoskeletal protein [Alphaproteobacteria bacterium]